MPMARLPERINSARLIVDLDDSVNSVFNVVANRENISVSRTVQPTVIDFLTREELLVGQLILPLIQAPDAREAAQ